MAEYIDRNFVYSKIRIYADACYVTGNNKEAKIAERIEQLVAEIPAADVNPVVRGKWILPTVINGRAFKIPHCSVCDGVPCGVDENTRFCPNCGARMVVDNG